MLRSTPINRCTRVFSVLLLVVTGLSAAHRHAHAGGDRAHRHPSAAEPLPATGTAKAETGWFAAPLHMHVFLLGFQFTLPADEPADNEPSTTDGHVVVVKLAGDTISSAAARPLAHDCNSPPCATNLAFALPVAPFIARGQELTPRAPWLCDAARHERSGVLRA